MSQRPAYQNKSIVQSHSSHAIVRDGLLFVYSNNEYVCWVNSCQSDICV